MDTAGNVAVRHRMVWARLCAPTGIVSGRQTYTYVYGVPDGVETRSVTHGCLTVLVVAPAGGGRLTVNVYYCAIKAPWL